MVLEAVVKLHGAICSFKLQIGATPQTPLLAARADKAGRVIAQIDRAVPLKVCAC